MASTINSVAHGFVANDPIYFSGLQGGDPIIENDLYYVLAANLTADTFEFSDTLGGTQFIFTTAITDGSVLPWPGYTPVVAGEVMEPPDSRAVTHSWPDAPGQPQNVIVAAGFKAIGCHWDATAVPDLMFYQFRYAPDDGTGTAPNTTLWANIQTRATTVWVDDRTIGQKYWTQVRSVDYTGNVVTSDVDPTAVNHFAAPEAGWTVALSVTPLAIGAADVAFNSVLTNILASNQIDAGTINVGLLKLQIADATMADGIEVWSGLVRVGKWDETGLFIGDAAGGVPDDLSGATYIKLTDAGLSVYRDGVLVSAITPDGINASAVTFGTLPGGHNIVLNSSFELADFAAAPTTKTWDVTADFTGTQVSQVNTANSNNTTISGTTY